MRNLTIAALVACAVGANAGGTLWDQVQLITHPGQGAGGLDASAIDAASGSNLFGWGAQNTAGNTMADDFMVGGAGWNITKLTFYSYQSFAGTTPTINGLFLKIYNANPLGQNPLTFGGVYGDLTTNEMDSVAFSNIYRVTETTLTNADRALMRVEADVNINLAAGAHWIAFNLTGTAASGPWTPPVSPQNAAFGVNAMQSTGTTGNLFATTVSPSQGDANFLIEGTVIPEPGTFIAIGIGLAGLALARRRK